MSGNNKLSFECQVGDSSIMVLTVCYNSSLIIIIMVLTVCYNSSLIIIIIIILKAFIKEKQLYISTYIMQNMHINQLNISYADK